MDTVNNTLVYETYISSDVKFYSIPELAKMLNWSEKTVQTMFNDPKFPSSDFGRSKVVEAHALIEYFSRKHVREEDRYWNKGAKRNGTRR